MTQAENDTNDWRYILVGSSNNGSVNYKRTVCGKNINLPHRCKSCDFAFPDEFILEAHSKVICELLSDGSTHLQNPVGVCKLCKLGFATAYNLKEHIKVEHPTICESQPIEIDSSSEKHVVDVHQDSGISKDQEPSYVLIGRWALPNIGSNFGIFRLNCLMLDDPNAAASCDNCKKGFVSASDLEAHASFCNLMKRLEIKQCLCSICDSIYSNFDTLRVHMSSEHTKDRSSAKGLQLQSSRLPQKNGTIDVTCHPCRRVLYSVDALANHDAVCVSVQPHVSDGDCLSIVSASSKDGSPVFASILTLPAWTSRDRSLKYGCKVCHFSFKDVASVSSHVPLCRTLASGFNHVCTLCSAGFKEIKSLNLHMEVHGCKLNNLLPLLIPSVSVKKKDAPRVYFGIFNGGDISNPPPEDETNPIFPVYNPRAEPLDIPISALQFECNNCRQWFHSLYFFLAHFDVCSSSLTSIYVCPLCCVSFNSPEKLVAHMMADVEQDEVADVICCRTGVGFPSLIELKSVSESTCSSEVKLVIVGYESKSRCKKTCNGIKYAHGYLCKGADSTEHGTATECKDCGFKFEDESHFMAHKAFCYSLFITSANISKPFAICCVCREGFRDLKKFKGHIDGHKYPVIAVPQSRPPPPLKPAPPPPPPPPAPRVISENQRVTRSMRSQNAIVVSDTPNGDSFKSPKRAKLDQESVPETKFLPPPPFVINGDQSGNQSNQSNGSQSELPSNHSQSNGCNDSQSTDNQSDCANGDLAQSDDELVPISLDCDEIVTIEPEPAKNF